jgi:hypothetical protein
MRHCGDFAALVAGVAAGSKAQLAPLWRAAADRGEVTGELYDGHWSDVGTRNACRRWKHAEENMKPNDSIPPARRAPRRLAQAMQGGVAVIPPRPSAYATATRTYPYRFDSHFYYLAGFPEPEAVW